MPSQETSAKRIVIKFGSGILTREGSVQLDDAQFASLTTAVAELQTAGHQAIIVSSGAVAAGLKAFALHSRPTATGLLQACAAVGQSRLMHFYEALFRQHDLHVAQLLVTNADFQTDSRRAKFNTTLENLLQQPNIVPIINENDSVATEELLFGDNDSLSADVAVLTNADLLILLTSVDGLADHHGNLVTSVDNVESVTHLIREETGQLSVGGMQTKLEAVRKSTAAHIETIIANGRNPSQINQLVAGHGTGTRFSPQ